MIEEFTKLEKLYTEFSEAYRAFAEKDQAARTTISIVSRRITEAKKETDAGIAAAVFDRYCDSLHGVSH